MYLEKFFGAAPSPHPCSGCGGEERLDFEVRMAFQPIVDARDRSIYGYEALVRTEDGGGAAEVIARVTPAQLYRFDQTCRVKAIETGIVPPTINYETPDPECDLDYTPNVKREAKIDTVLTDNLGFGGHNATLVFRRH